MKLSLKHWLLTSAIVITVPTAASALDGAALDPTFGSGGVALYQPPLPPYVLNSGSPDNELARVFPVGDRYVAVGITNVMGNDSDEPPYLWLARIINNGALDKSFSPSGYTMHVIPNTIWGSRWESVFLTHVSHTPDGKWLVGLDVVLPELGSSSHRLWRLNADFSLDASFDSDGVVDLPESFFPDFNLGVAQMTGGRMLVVGSRHDGASWRPAMLHLSASGTIESTLDISGPHVGALSWRKMALLPDGYLIIAGHDTSNVTSAHFAAIRIRPDGTQDMGFGYSGLSYVPLCFGYTPDIQPWAKMTSMALDRSNRMVMVGEVRGCARNVRTSIGVARIHSSGYGDGTFWLNGGRNFDFNPTSDTSLDAKLSLQSDGKLVISSSVWAASDWRCGVTRLNENGAFDLSFGQGRLPGRAVHYGSCNAFNGVLLDEMSGRPVLFGRGADSDDFSITRLAPGSAHSPYPY